MSVDQSVINFSVYEDANDFLGMASATLPNLDALTQSISGAGIAGNVEAVIIGHLNAMTTQLSFRTFSEGSVKLSEPREHHIDLRVAQQVFDQVSGTHKVQSVKHVLVLFPKAESNGKVAPASPSDGSGDFATRLWRTYIDGQLVREVDQYNFIYMVNGVDYLADVRKALGR